MTRHQDPLSHVKIASPCTADWEGMVGDARRRFCGQCELNVYNLSDMTRREAEDLITRTEGRLCVRFYRRADGTILTKDCPVGLRALKRRLSYVRKAVVSSVLSFFAGFGAFVAAQGSDGQEVGSIMPVQQLTERQVQLESHPPGQYEEGGLAPVYMGDPAYVPKKKTRRVRLSNR